MLTFFHYFLQAWYDVKIISKEYKHDLSGCACKFKVKFYGESSKNIDIEKRRVLLEGTEMEVTIHEIGIMQVTFKSPLESIIEETFTLSKRRMRKQWSKDIYALNLNCVFQKPVFSVSKEEDAGTTLIKPVFSVTKEEDAGTTLIKAGSEIPTSCSDNGFSEENCTQDSFVHGKGRKRARVSLPRKAKVLNGGVYAENGRSVKRDRTENEKDLLCRMSDESSSSYQYSSTDESCDLEHTESSSNYLYSSDHSLSRSTPVFYGSIDKDQSKSTSTRTFYGNTSKFNENSNSTEVFYGKEVDTNLSTCSDKLNCEERSGCHCENMQTSSDCSHSMSCKACKILEVDSSPPTTMPTSSSFQEESLNKDQAQNDSIKTTHSDSIKMPSDSDSERPSKVSRRQGDMKRGQYQAQNDSIKMPADRGMKTNRICSDSERPPSKFPRRAGDTKREQKPKFGQRQPRTMEREEEKAKKPLFQSKSAIPRNQGRARSSWVQEGKKDFNDLFERILNNVHELQRVKGMMSSEHIVSSMEEKQNQVPWDPLIFYEKEDLRPNLETIPEDDPFKSIWRDMESAFEEMVRIQSNASLIKGRAKSCVLMIILLCIIQEMHEAAPAQPHDQPWNDRAPDCEHHLVLNEEEGYVCSHCGFLVTSIENICPPIQEDKVKIPKQVW